jgi:DNA-binding IscR family transcriptional regulator
MKSALTVQYALMCLQELGDASARAVSAQEISARQGIPRAECEAVLQCLENAGLIKSPQTKHFALTKPLEEFKVLEILEALADQRKPAPSFKILFQHERPALRKTLEAVSWAGQVGAYPSDGTMGAN